jgi:two-component system, chemotaxis family, protein-glutamate methylesterase/glutaminase
MSRPIRVLIIDDSALVREILTEGLDKDPGIEVVGSAIDPYNARDKIVQLKPDVLSLDVEMPRMDGVEFLRKLMPQYPLPVVMVSALTEKGKQITFEALEAGAVDFVAKPKADLATGLKSMMLELRTKLAIASTANVSHWKNKKELLQDKGVLKRRALSESTNKVIAIGASTGGTEAIREVVGRLPVTTPGVVIVQHMPAGFTRMFADRLNRTADMTVKEAESGDRIMNGRVLIAPGGKQMCVIRQGGEYRVSVQSGELVNGHCPSVEVLFKSVANSVGANCVGVMLTGMGRDGADAMKTMRDKGARCVAQDQASCVVFGMPQEAYASGGVERLVSLKNMAATILDIVESKG